MPQAAPTGYSVDVHNPGKATRRLSIAAVLLTSLPVLSPVTASSQAPANPAPPPSVAAGIFPLDRVHRGLHGVAYTVFEGTQPEAMDLEILGVLHNMRGPGEDMILARLTSTKPEYTGVVAGMSGSPVYIDGKLVGALAYRIGQFSKEAIAGITPIADMLQVRDQTTTPPAPTGAGTGMQTGSSTGKGQGASSQTELQQSGANTSPDNSVIHPIETPLVFNGYGTEAIKLWQNHPSLTGQLGTGQLSIGQASTGQAGSVQGGMSQTGPAGNLIAVAGVGGSSSNQPQPEPIVPGSAVSAILVRGDLDISATCTVTYVDEKQLLACGHPITQFGPISMPMTKAEVVATLPSPLNAFKIVNTTETVGSFDQDREAAIRGRFGATARMLPVAVHIGAAGSEHTVHFEVVDQPEITPAAIMISVYQSLLSRNGYSAESTLRFHGTLELDGLPPLHFDSILAPTDQSPSALGAAMLIAERFERLYDDASRRTTFKNLTLDFESIPGRQLVQIDTATTDVTRVHAGETVTIAVTLKPYRGEQKNLRFPVTLPANLPPGPVRLLLSDGATLDRVMQPARPKPLDLSATIEQLNGLHPNDRLYVTLLDPAAQASLEGRTLTGLPLSMANVLEPLRSNQEMTLNGESVLPVTSIPVDAMVAGLQVIFFNVE